MSKITIHGTKQPRAVSGHVPAEVSRFRVTPFGLPPNIVQTYGPDPMIIQQDGINVVAFAGMTITVGLFNAGDTTDNEPPQYNTSVQWSALFEVNYSYQSEDASLELTLYAGSGTLTMGLPIAPGNCNSIFPYSYVPFGPELPEPLPSDVYYSFTGSHVQLASGTWSPC